MSYQSILEYLQSLVKFYFAANKKQKTQLLNHATQVTGHHRKDLIRKLGQAKPLTNNKKKKCGAKRSYPPELLIPHLKALWFAMEQISAPRMKAALKDWLPFYRDNGIDAATKDLLLKMSVSTLRRLLQQVKKESRSEKGLTSTSPARHMKNKVPINTLDSTITRPGYVQTDTVAHCGDSLAGEFMNSVTVTDINSAWTENRALFTKKAAEVKEMLSDIDKGLPFELIAINSDSGSEFLNVPVFNYWRERKVAFTRSRPYKKNDNCYVEQKNFTHVRELFGYQRIEEAELKAMMNDIYKNCWNPLQNFFLPTFKLKEKIRIGARIKKTYGEPITPYSRLMQSAHVTEEAKAKLLATKNQLDPFKLKQELEQKLSLFQKKLDESKIRRKDI